MVVLLSGEVVLRGFCALSAAGAPDLLASLADGAMLLPEVIPPEVPPLAFPPVIPLPDCDDAPPLVVLLFAFGLASPPIVEAPGAFVLCAKAIVDDKARTAAVVRVAIFIGVSSRLISKSNREGASLFPQILNYKLVEVVRSEGLEPPRFYSLPPQGSASTNSATSAFAAA